MCGHLLSKRETTRSLRTLLWACVWSLAACGSEPTPPQRYLPAVEVPSGVIQGAQDTFIGAISGITVEGIITHRPNASGGWLLLEVDPARYELQLLSDLRRGMAAADVLDDQSTAVIGSGFVADLHSLTPVGLLQRDGQVLSQMLPHGYTRVLGINDKGPGVVHREQYQRGLFHSALQVGPGIIEQGRLDISERDLQRPKYFRSVVGVCEQRWLLGITLEPMHLYTLGKQLHAYFAQQGWQCDEVVNLAGDREAVLAIKDGRRILYHGDPNTHKVTLLSLHPI